MDNNPPPVYLRLLKVLTQEQAEQLIELLERVQARAVERSSDQNVTITFNSKGYPKYINGTDNYPVVIPKTYGAE